MDTGNPQPFAGELLAIAGELAGIQRFFREVKAQPGAPGTDFRPRAAHPAGEMLKMADGISHVAALPGSGVFHDPDERAVGRRVGFQNRLIAREIRHPGFVELENRLCGFSGNPLGLGETQGVVVEFRVFRMAVTTGQREVVDLGNFRKPRAGGEERWKNGSDTTNGVIEFPATLNPQPFTLNFFATFPGLHLLPDRQFSPPHE